MKKSTYHPKKTAILIILLFLSGMLIGNLAQRFRFSEYRWVYQYGSLLNIIMMMVSITWSLIHPLIIWSEKKTEWEKELIWIIIGMLPLLYFIIGLSIK